LEIKFREEWSWEIGVLIASFEDDAMEFVVCYSYREIRFCFPARRKTGEEFGVEKRYPCCLSGDPPVKKS